MSNVNPNTEYTYWVENATTYVKPKTFTAGTLNNNIVNKEGYANSTATVILFDELNNVNVHTPANNVSFGAGATVNIKLKYQGTFQGSAMPFGGILVVEANQSIPTINCNGADISNVVPYSSLSYTASSTANRYVQFGVNPTLDDGSATAREINCQFKNGATDSSSLVKFTFIPANYYVANDGSILLDVQKTANQDTTATGLGRITAQTYFS